MHPVDPDEHGGVGGEDEGQVAVHQVEEEEAQRGLGAHAGQDQRRAGPGGEQAEGDPGQLEALGGRGSGRRHVVAGSGMRFRGENIGCVVNSNGSCCQCRT